MNELLTFLQSGQIKTASPDHLKKLAAREALNLKALRAIIIVESGGRHPFDAHNRPFVLYEPHIYHKLLPAAKRTEAITKNLARKTADKTYYNQFEKTPDDRWDLLDRATAFHDIEAAVGSCSWGPAQIVASIWAKAIGYASVADFARAAMDEGKMLDAFAAVLAGMKLKSAINDLDFESVARTYNGSGAVEVYAGRMQKAFDGL